MISDLRELNNTWFVKIQQVAIRGIPDFLLCVNGRFVAMELKATDHDEPNPLQKFTLSSISSKGGVGLVVTPSNWDNTLIILRELDDGIDNLEHYEEGCEHRNAANDH